MIIEKKILRKEWCRNLLITSLSLFLLLVLGNLISGFMRSSVNAYEVLINQLLRTPDTITKILPTSCLIASLMTINNLIKSNQLVSIYASGFSPIRVFKKIFFWSFSKLFPIHYWWVFTTFISKLKKFNNSQPS